MTKLNKRLAIICQNKQLPFIFEEAEHLGLDVTFFYNSQENCPGNLPAVDRSVPIPLFEDEEKAMNIVKQTFVESPFDGVVTLFEPALHFTAKAAAELNLPGLPLQTIENCRNKSETRRILRQHGLNIPFFQEAAAYEDLEHVQLTFPLVVKPINGFSSQGVVRADDRKQLKEAMRKAEDINKGDLSRFVTGKKGIIVEQFVDGPEFAIETLSIQGKVHVLSIGYKGDCKGPFFEEGVYIAPAKLDEEAHDSIIREVTAAVSALGIHQGPAHTELRLDKSGQPYVIEVGARIGGSGISHYIVKESTGINFMQLVIQNALKPLDRHLEDGIRAKRTAGNYIIPVQGSGTFEKIDGLEDIKQRPEVKRVFQFIKPGAEILPYPHFSGYPGFILTSHDSYEECEAFYRKLDGDLAIIYKNNLTGTMGG
ncbi:phosphoribosylglycinamide synthetase [Bacillus glycinifermentans]|uniref:ATP-grasp domain-containing protein n=1 Tax=Bacillus glycinifermentans TaxID=1664069 RepID=A0A0J6HJL2_9BACI|nr:ATP-grasp domain-containing protein [Bacillus glycinifermentans]ATH93819.1 phosphoribosylglycinamide synthetase [Bacillus glycinifermentans]KMM59392.1 phosphoribosylglycinamide synthetase [Bacillus glycinifermentans]KRT90003.1 phosphoribosylglycinamide synthetase [Bacillus glycinifermentans]MBU8786159.1 ATP-grasp domain-containing protein [Bacillus glycinifermentans]MEC0483676.1 ATP-grasp domain-containing protein [Bacillus glycinifermentans]